MAQSHERLGTRKIVFDALSCTKASANVGAGTRRLRDLGSALGDLSPQRAERGTRVIQHKSGKQRRKTAVKQVLTGVFTI